MKTCAFLFCLLCSFLIATDLPAQDDASLLSLERIFTGDEFSARGFGPTRWLESGSGYTALEASGKEAGGNDIVFYDPGTGERKVLVPSSKLVPDGQSAALTVDDYAWSEDGNKLLIFTNTQRVWRTNTRGDYFVLHLDTGLLRKLGKEAEPSTLMFAKFSPGGNRVAYVCNNNLFVEEIETGAITPLTHDGSKTVINGTFDWVYEEELGLRDGFRWSPDGTRIAYWQLDSEGVPVFYMINNTETLYPRLIPVQYPKAGQANSACRVGVVSASGGETQWMHVEGDSRNFYIARMDWAANSDEIVFQRLNRLQNTNQVMLGDARTGGTRVVLSEKDEAWVNVVNDLIWLNDGEAFTWLSERDGWLHLYKVSRHGETIEPVTSGDFDLISVEKIDTQGGWVYFIASPENPTQRFLFRARLDGTGKPVRLTPAGLEGTHDYQISPDAKWAIHTRSSFGTPPKVELVSLPDHQGRRTLEDNAELIEKLSALKRGPEGFFRVAVGNGVDLDAWWIKPPGFDPAMRYPVLFYVYGEPAGQTVLDQWGRRNYLWHRMLAQQGYVIVSVDNRGTPAPRGRAWRKCIYRQVGILASIEQATAVRKIMETCPWVDAGRIGVWGWSGGGTMSLNLIFRYPELYRMAMSIAPVSDQRYYDTIYQERFMGLPQDNVDGFRDGSPITHAHRLEGDLLLVHGTGDDNCHFQNTEALVNELIRHNKPFTMMAYPNRSHSIYEGKNTSLHLYSLLTRFLNEKLPLDEKK
ncbi:MAG: S9 family peptidase [Planctomycetota bacterium]